MAQPNMFAAGNPILADDSKLKPCYLVIQPTKWCHGFKHPVEVEIFWRQCHYHWSRSWKTGEEFTLCPPAERERRWITLPCSHINDPARVAPNTQCLACTAIKDDASFQSARQRRNRFRIMLANPQLEDQMRPQYEAGLAEADAQIADIIRYHQKQLADSIRRGAQDMYLTNPELRIHTGHVHEIEERLRPQFPFPMPLETFLYVQHPTKRMRDP